MSRWADVESAVPEFAARVRAIFDQRRHKTLATLRGDGSPRLSGIEVEFHDGQIVLGMMPGSRKLADIQRDPRMAVQALSDDPPDDPSLWRGDATISGRAVQVVTHSDHEDASPRFTLDVETVVMVRIGTPADHLEIESWHLRRGLEVRRRS